VKSILVALLAGAIVMTLPMIAESQERVDLQQIPPQQVQQMQQVQMPGALPEILSITPVGPDGAPYLRPGETFVITGKNFVPGKTTIGIRTWVAGDAAIPPQAHEFVASITPATVAPHAVEGFAPGGIALGNYLLWVHVQGAGHSKPVSIRFSPKAAPPANPPKISSVAASPPDLKTKITGSNFGSNTMVVWPVGLSEVAEFVNPNLIRARVPKALKPGNYQVMVEVNGVFSQPATFTVLDPMPLNLYWDETDLNGIPLNPVLGWQLVHDYDAADYYPDIPTLAPKPSGFWATGWWPWPSLTNQEIYTDSFFLCPGSHVNWKIPVTYEGYWRWSSHTPPCWTLSDPCDDDYNFYFFAHEGAGATDREGSRGGIMTEFDSDETIDHFHTKWWDDFHKAVDNGDSSARAMVDRRWGIATALWGLDCAHECWSELHPVWAMAIHVNDDPIDDRWSIFVRNWGNQGFCSTDQHLLILPKDGQRYVYKLRIPWRPGATSVTWSDEFLQRGNIGRWVKAVPGVGVVVQFNIPVGADKPRINGQLKLAWKYPPGQSPQPYDRSRSAWVNVSNAVGIKVSEELEIYRQATSSMTPEQKNQFDAKMSGIVSKQAMVPDSQVPTQDPPPVVSLAVAPAASIPSIQTSPDAIKVQKAQLIEQAARDVGAQISKAQPQLQPMTARPVEAAPTTETQPDLGDLMIEGRTITAQPPETTFEHGVNRAGGDYKNFNLSEPRPELCRDACIAEAACKAYTYVKPGIQGSSARCWLKSSEGTPRPDGCCVSGVKP
jgi:hypothetical protein